MTDLSTSTQSTLDLVDFETVRDDGVIDTPETYTRLIELTPRPWLTASESTRDSIYTAFTRALRGIRFPVQFLTYTSSVPIDAYLQRFEQVHTPRDAQPGVTGARTAVTDGDSPKTANNRRLLEADADANADRHPDPDAQPDGADRPSGEATDGGVVDTVDGHTVTGTDGTSLARNNAAAADEVDGVDGSPVLAYGRLAHAQWLEQAVQTGAGRDRQYFVAIGVRKDSAPPASRSTLEDLRYTIRQFRSTRRDSVDPETEQRCLSELRKRTQHLASSLPKTGVETEILTDRPSVLAVLYQYYHAEPARVTLDHAWLTRTDREPDPEPATDASVTETESPVLDDDDPDPADAITSSGGGDNGGA